MLSRWLLKSFGWKLVFVAPPGSKGVVIFYPHTSNWDFSVGVLARGATDLPVSYVAKDSLFRWPFGAVFRALGGIPVNRRISTGFIGQLVGRFAAAERLYIAIAPEGTRGHVNHLKSGFYYLALQASVPLGLGFVDYRLKEVGIGAWLDLSGDAALDFERIRDFYAGKQGRVPANAGDIRLRDEADVVARVRPVDE